MLLTSIAAGCTYLRQRARDAADIITVGVEDGGFGASLQAGPIRVPSLYYGDGGGAGLVGGQFTTYDYDQWDALLAARTYLGGIDDDTRAKESSLAYYAAIVPVPGSKGMLVDLHQPTDHEFGWSSPRRWGPRVGQVEISAGIGGGVRIGFNVVEALDFFGGWFGLDLLDDDPPWFPPDRPKRIPERLPAPGETPQPSHDEMRPQHPLAMRFPGAFGTRWFAVDLGGRKIGVAVRSLTHDASARRLVTQLDFAIFPAGEGPFLSMRSELSSFEDEAPYVLVSQDEFERLTGRDHFTHDDWSEAGGRRKQLIAGVYRERELHSTRPKLTLFGPVPIETPFESLDAGFRGATDLDDPRGATQFEVVERVPGSSGDPLSSRVTIREWKQGGVAEQSTYRSDGVLVAYVTGAMEWDIFFAG